MFNTAIISVNEQKKKKNSLASVLSTKGLKLYNQEIPYIEIRVWRGNQIRKSMDRKHNGHKKNKQTDKQRSTNITHKTRDW